MPRFDPIGPTVRRLGPCALSKTRCPPRNGSSFRCVSLAGKQTAQQLCGMFAPGCQYGGRERGERVVASSDLLKSLSSEAPTYMPLHAAPPSLQALYVKIGKKRERKGEPCEQLCGPFCDVPLKPSWTATHTRHQLLQMRCASSIYAFLLREL